MRCRDDGHEELETTMEALEEEDELKVWMTIVEASMEEAEETTRPSERLQHKSWWCVYGIRVLTKTTAASVE